MNPLDNTVTQEEVKRLFEYNQETGIVKRLVSVSSNARKGDIVKSFQKKGKTYYSRVAINGRRYRTHRIIWLYMTGEWPDKIDHKDHNGLNNKWPNLRSATCLENQRNRSRSTNNKSGITGVHWCKKTKKWVSQIKVGSSPIPLGRFADFFEACCIRKSTENRLDFHKNHGSERL